MFQMGKIEVFQIYRNFRMYSSTHTWKVAIIDGSQIKDAESFHREFRFKFGFPDYYGMNLDALSDCLSSLDEPGISRHFKLGKSEELVIRINDSSIFMNEAPKLFENFLEIIIDTNAYYQEIGLHIRILLELI